MIITNFRWRNWEPELVIENGGSEEMIMPIMNQKIRFRIGDRFCIGYTRNGKSFDCPDKNNVDSGRRNWKITSKEGAAKINKIEWTKTILDVRLENAENYCVDVTTWAKAALMDSEEIVVPSFN